MGRKWTKDENIKLLRLAEFGLKPGEIAKKLLRTKISIYNRAVKLKITFINSPFHSDGKRITVNDLSGLWERRIKNRLVEIDNCIEWIGSTDSKGYGQIRAFGKLWYIHRIALSIAIGRFLKKREHALHRCDNPLCCNKDHLFVGTHQDNVKDMIKKGRGGGQFKKGHKSIVSPKLRYKKYSAEIVRAARKEHKKTGIGHKRLAKKYGMSPANMQAILRYRTWKHVE